jgi:hypothetical protein
MMHHMVCIWQKKRISGAGGNKNRTKTPFEIAKNRVQTFANRFLKFGLSFKRLSSENRHFVVHMMSSGVLKLAIVRV